VGRILAGGAGLSGRVIACCAQVVDDEGLMAGRSIHPGTLVDVAVQLHRDEAVGAEVLAERDRAVGLRLEVPESAPSELVVRVGLLVRWLRTLQDSPGAARSGGAALTTVGLGAVLLGLVLGLD